MLGSPTNLSGTPPGPICSARLSPQTLLRRSAAFAVALFLATTPLLAQRKVTKLADGVYEIHHLEQAVRSGNTTVIIGDRQVLVVDSGFLPSQAKEDISDIRKWTDKPVAFVLNTHFHNDHNFGNRTYMDAFPAVTIIAHVETKKDMDRFGPGSARREQGTVTAIEEMLKTGKASSSSYLTARALTKEEVEELNAELPRRKAIVEELKSSPFQTATLTFKHDFTIDLGNREVQIKFLGRGNTAGDAVAYLPREKILAAGDLVSWPLPNTIDGYPSEWVETLENLANLDIATVVPGHGELLHDKAYVNLVHDFVKSAVDQMNEKLSTSYPAMFQTLDDVKGSVDLAPFRERFAKGDKEVEDVFDRVAANLVKVVYEEATQR